jgi:YVTN family beta-propeller protein
MHRMWLSVVCLALLTADAAAQPFAYVLGQPQADGAAATVTVIDTSSPNNLIMKFIEVGANCVCAAPDSMAMVPNGSRLYVTNQRGNSVSVIDTTSNTVIGTIPVGSGPVGAAASPDGARVYIVNGSGATSVSVIDTATNGVIASIPLGVAQPMGIAVTPDGGRLYVSAAGASSLLVIDTASLSITKTIPVGNSPLSVDLSPDGSLVYVAALLSNAVSVISTASDTVVATIPVANPASARPSPDGSRVYVANVISNTISVVNALTNSVMATVSVAHGPQDLAFTPDGALVYVASANWVSTISTATNTVIRTMQINVPRVGFPSAVVIGTPPAPALPAQPQSVQTSISGSTLTVSWVTGVGGAPTAHQLRFFQAGALLASVTTGPASSAQIGIPPGISGAFTVTVTPYAGAAPGPTSSPASFTIGSAGPGQPTGVNAMVSGGILTVIWSTGSGATPTAHVLNFYQGGTPVANLTVGAANSAQIDIPPGISGTFAVTVTPLANTAPGPSSAPASFTIGGCLPPPAVSGLVGTVVAGTGTVTWNPSAGATGYIIKAGANQGGAELYDANIGTATSVAASGLPSGFMAWVRVFAINGCGTSAHRDVLVQ